MYEEFIKVDNETGCHVWIGPASRRNGVRQCPMITVAGKRLSAKRVVFEHHFGILDADLFVVNSCGCKSCVNPEHMEVSSSGNSVKTTCTVCGSEKIRTPGDKGFSCRACRNKKQTEARRSPEGRRKSEIYKERSSRPELKKRKLELQRLRRAAAKLEMKK